MAFPVIDPKFCEACGAARRHVFASDSPSGLEADVSAVVRGEGMQVDRCIRCGALWWLRTYTPRFEYTVRWDGGLGDLEWLWENHRELTERWHGATVAHHRAELPTKEQEYVRRHGGCVGDRHDGGTRRPGGVPEAAPLPLLPAA